MAWFSRKRPKVSEPVRRLLPGRAPSQSEPRWIWDGIDPVKGRFGHWEPHPPLEPPGARDDVVVHSLYAELSRPALEPSSFWHNLRPGSWWERPRRF